MYKKSFPLVLLFLHCDKQVESCGQKSSLYFPSLRSNRQHSSWLMSQTSWASVCESSVYAKLHTLLQETPLYRLQSNFSAMIFSSSSLVELCDKHITQTKQAIMDEKREILRKPRQALHVLSMQCGTHRTLHTQCTAHS